MEAWTFQSTPPARGATSDAQPLRSCAYLISIHAPREGGDCNKLVVAFRIILISIHAPREGGDASGQA